MDNAKKLYEKMNSIIKKIYIEKDYDLFYRLCANSDFNLSDEIINFTKDKNIKIDDLNYNNVLEPVSDWNFHFPDYRHGDGLTKYRTYFAISKLCNIFYINHYFEIKDLNPESLITDSMLEGVGFCGDPIIYDQAELMNIIRNEMKKLGFRQLGVCDAQYTFHGLKQCGLVNTIYDDIPGESPQVTYFDLFFSDAMGCNGLNMSNGFSGVDQTPENQEAEKEKTQKPDDRSCL